MRTPPMTATRLRVWSMVPPQGAPLGIELIDDGEARQGLPLSGPLLRSCATQRGDVRLLLVGLKVQRAAAERRKASAEDHAGVDEIGALDDLLVADLVRLLDQGSDELTPQPFELERIEGCLRLSLFGLAVFPHVEALARLLAELAGGDQLVQPVGATGSHLEDFADVRAHVEAHRIGKLN